MHCAFEKIEPVFNKFKSNANIETEIRIGKITRAGFDTNIGEVKFKQILEGLERYMGWENVIKTHTTTYIKGNLRVIDDEVSGKTTAQVKTRIKKIDVPLPDRPVDIRFSVSTEVACDKPEDIEYEDMRVKHRTSFIRKNLSIDMTKVTADPDDLDSEENTTYEIELEIIAPSVITSQDELYNIVHKVDDILKLLTTS